MQENKLTYLDEILQYYPEWVPDWKDDYRTNDFVDTRRFSPVVYDPSESMPEKDNPDYQSWWIEQYHRCIKGYVVQKATKRGHSIWIPGRYYFYLNFWKIMAKLEGVDRKGLRNPRFTSLDYFKAMAVEVMFLEKKDQAFGKARQKGFSEFIASNLAYNFIFIPYSINVIVAGISDYSEHTMENTVRGLNDLADTEFYKRRSPDRADFKRAIYTEKIENKDENGMGLNTFITVTKGYGSELYCITAKDNTQAVSRLTPFMIVYEECFGKGTKILMADGKFKNVEDIRVGDKVLNSKSHVVEVALTGGGVDDLYLVEQKKGDSYVVNSKHRLYLEQHTNIFGYKEDDGTKKLNVKEINLLNKTKRSSLFGVKSDGIEFDKQTLPIDPYIFGLWLGDGAKSSMCITTQDDEIENALQTFSKNNDFNCKTTYYKNSTNRKVNISTGNGFTSSILKKLNVWNNKHIPDSYLKNSLENRLFLLAGLIDTDGHLQKSSSSYSFSYEITQRSKILSDNIVDLCMSCGFNVKRSIKIINNVEYYRLRITGDLNRIPVLLKRKKISEDYKQTSNPLHSQIKISPIGKGDYFGITLKTEDDDERILVINDYTLSMNCGKWKSGSLIETSEFVRPSLFAEGKKTGYQVFIGTGGDIDESVADVQKIMYNPDAYNIKSYKNIFEENQDVTTGRVGCFIPGYLFEIIDEDGNSMVAESIESIMVTRKGLTTESEFRASTQKPIYLSEMFMMASGGFFGRDIVARINDRKRLILNHRELQMVQMGNLKWIDPLEWSKGVEWEADINGIYAITEHPQLDPNGKHYINLYNSATDSYDKDSSESSDSKGSQTIWKNTLNANSTYKMWVARLTQRPSEEEGGSPAFYENTVKLCVYYGNCENLIEYSNVLIFDYYKRWNMEYLLKERPTLVIAQHVLDPKANQKYGIEPSFVPHALKMLKEALRADNYALIAHIYDIIMLERFAMFKVATDYNCDITISSAFNIAAATEDRELSVFSESDFDEEDSNYGGFRMTNNFIMKI